MGDDLQLLVSETDRGHHTVSSVRRQVHRQPAPRDLTSEAVAPTSVCSLSPACTCLCLAVSGVVHDNMAATTTTSPRGDTSVCRGDTSCGGEWVSTLPAPLTLWLRV